MREDAVKRNSSFFISIEALIEEVTKKAPVLRYALAVDTRCRSDGMWVVFGIRREVAYGSEPASGNYRIGNNINVFVNFARLKAPL